MPRVRSRAFSTSIRRTNGRRTRDPAALPSPVSLSLRPHAGARSTGRSGAHCGLPSALAAAAHGTDQPAPGRTVPSPGSLRVPSAPRSPSSRGRARHGPEPRRSGVRDFLVKNSARVETPNARTRARRSSRARGRAVPFEATGAQAEAGASRARAWNVRTARAIRAATTAVSPALASVRLRLAGHPIGAAP